MTKAFWQFWLFLIPGIAVSHLISVFSHDLMGIPRGVPFGRFGIIGSAAQISLLLLPFAIGAALAAIFYFKRHEAKAGTQEVFNCAKKIGRSCIGFDLPVLCAVRSMVWPNASTRLDDYNFPFCASLGGSGYILGHVSKYYQFNCFLAKSQLKNYNKQKAAP